MRHFDVIPLSIGVSTDDGRFLGVIPRNTSVPFQASESFFTSENDQREITFAVFSFKCRLKTFRKFRSMKVKVKYLPIIVILVK